MAAAVIPKADLMLGHFTEAFVAGQMRQVEVCN
jgi:hypothetical protein